jgi:multidrug efflux pump subunit AcrA (membrane-fusion protein)
VQQAPDLRVGLPVQIVSEAGEVVATERLDYVASSVDESTQTVLAKATLSSQAGRFRSDQYVRVRLVWSTEPTLTVPLVSVLRISGQQFVYVAEPGDGGALIAHLRSVSLGPVVGDNYVVRGGVSAGDRLITSGIQKIGDGAPVQALPPGGMPAGGGGGGR